MNEAEKTDFLSRLSQAARDQLDPILAQPPADPPEPDDIPGWQRLQALVEERSKAACDLALDTFNPVIVERVYAGIPALEVYPAEADPDLAPLVYVHGGGYTTFSARSSLFASVPLAVDLERTLISLDYPLAPAAKFGTTVPAMAGALASLSETCPGAVLAGESAGGGLVLSAVNQLIKRDKQAFSSLVLISPWTDLADRGDSRLTQRNHDPLLRYEPALAACAEAYAPGKADAPEASPVLAEYDRSFPPTLILCGTREILLSDSVRLARRLRESQVQVELDVYDGLFHSFPIIAPLAPEAFQARISIKSFLNRVQGRSR
ncbi:MAG: alpha/beta hydrolase [Xanthomonadales bacterium]|nr:alpha/beta hydrolase [Xanthomonadales bacterium]